jgi:nucleoside-diphosphate-sugar epimerase
VLDATRAKIMLGWIPATALDQGLEQTLAYFRNPTPS